MDYSFFRRCSLISGTVCVHKLNNVRYENLFAHAVAIIRLHQSIAFIYISETFHTTHFLLVLILMYILSFGCVTINGAACYCDVRSCGKKKTRAVRGPVTLIPTRAFSIGAVATCFYDSGLSRLGFEHLLRSNPLRQRRGLYMSLISALATTTSNCYIDN